MASSTIKALRPRGRARREALLDAALQVVAEAGVDAVTHRRVAEAAGLPLASTTYWFESKEHLLTAALERAAERDIERLRAFLAEGLRAEDRQAGEDPHADELLDLAVGAILGSSVEPAQSSRAWLLATYALVLEAARQPSLRAVTARWTEAYMAAIPPLLAAAGSRTPRDDAELLLAAADGLLVDQLATGEDADLAPRLRRLAGALVRA